ncbi:hypothetical protein ACGFMM_18610 [Streptomyces sp. NPDC048604]|uniref:hypothetical protein n=1 Tax=Streptomyces sp. NPDC048604 TaxID=3365578 RepID=UPI00371F08BB
MSLLVPNDSGAVITRAVNAEMVGGPLATGRLLMHSSATRGALSTVRMTRREGADGAAPHDPGSSPDLLIVMAPGTELFEYVRLLDRIRTGKATVLDSPEWQRDRAAFHGGRPA